MVINRGVGIGIFEGGVVLYVNFKRVIFALISAITLYIGNV